jgi:hypothetical protein
MTEFPTMFKEIQVQAGEHLTSNEQERIWNGLG